MKTKLGKYTLIDILQRSQVDCRGLTACSNAKVSFSGMSSNFTLQSRIDCESIEEKFRFNNLIGFKRFKHSNTGLNVNFANVAGPLYTMAVVVPVLIKILVKMCFINFI